MISEKGITGRDFKQIFGVTMKDVSQELGVTSDAVSMVLRNQPASYELMSSILMLVGNIAADNYRHEIKAAKMKRAKAIQVLEFLYNRCEEQEKKEASRRGEK